MKKRILGLACAALLLMGLATSPARSVEIPDGIETNCQRGEFGQNKYANLKLAMVEEWLDASEEGELPVAAVELEFREPEGGDQPEKVETAFMVMDSKFNQISPVLGGGVRDSGMVVFKWDAKDKEGRRVKDGAYKVLMNIKGERHGELLMGAIFPLNLVSAPPAVSDAAISTRKAVLEYGGAPALTFTSTGFGLAMITDTDAEGNEVSHWEGPMPQGKHTLRSDLMDKDDKPFEPGQYTTRIVIKNTLGESEALTFEYELAAPPPLEAAVKLNAPANLKVKGDEAVPFTVTLNQPAYVELRHVADNGKIDFIGKSVEGRPSTLYPKGTHEFTWLRIDTEEFERYETGTHWVQATIRTLAGGEDTIESNRVSLAPAPKPPEQKPRPQKTPVKQEAKRGIPNLKLSFEPEHVVIGGGRMVVKVRYSLDQDSMIKLTVYDKRGRVVKKLIDSQNEHIKKGSYWKELDVEDFDYGAYKVVFEAVNFYGERNASGHFSVGWR